MKQIEALGKDLEIERLRIAEINNERLELRSIRVELETKNGMQADRIIELE